MRVYGITGWKDSGKTGLMERLVTDITDRGFSVSTVKHAHHVTEIDQPGRDSYRHREAGAREVLVASPVRWALIHELRGDAEWPLEGLLERLSPVDLVLIEGYKRAPHPKIEVHRGETGHELLSLKNATIRAVASDRVLTGLTVPMFDLNATVEIADFVLKEVSL